MRVQIITKMPPDEKTLKRVKISKIIDTKDMFLLPRGSFSVIKQTPLTKILDFFTRSKSASKLSMVGSGDVLVKGVNTNVKVSGAGFAKVEGAKDVVLRDVRRGYAQKNTSADIRYALRTSIASHNEQYGEVSNIKNGDGIACHNGGSGSACDNGGNGIACYNGWYGFAERNKLSGIASCNEWGGRARENGLSNLVEDNGSEYIE